VAESKAQLQAQVQQIQAQVPPPAQDTNGDSSEMIEKLKAELLATQKEADDLRTSAAIAAASSTPSDSTKTIGDQVAEQVALIRTELEAVQTERIKQAEATYQSRADKMKKTLTSKLAEGKEAIRQQMRKEHDEAVQQLRSEHEAAIQQFKSEEYLLLSQTIKITRDKLITHTSRPASRNAIHKQKLIVFTSPDDR